MKILDTTYDSIIKTNGIVEKKTINIKCQIEKIDAIMPIFICEEIKKWYDEQPYYIRSAIDNGEFGSPEIVEDVQCLKQTIRLYRCEKKECRVRVTLVNIMQLVYQHAQNKMDCGKL